jgi:hypothetical protein
MSICHSPMQLDVAMSETSSLLELATERALRLALLSQRKR